MRLRSYRAWCFTQHAYSLCFWRMLPNKGSSMQSTKGTVSTVRLTTPSSPNTTHHTKKIQRKYHKYIKTDYTHIKHNIIPTYTSDCNEVGWLWCVLY